MVNFDELNLPTKHGALLGWWQRVWTVHDTFIFIFHLMSIDRIGTFFTDGKLLTLLELINIPSYFFQLCIHVSCLTRNESKLFCLPKINHNIG